MSPDQERIATETTEVKIKGQNFEALFDPRFVELLDREFGSIKFLHACLVNTSGTEEVAESGRERLFIGYTTPSNEKKSEYSVKAETQESLDKIINALNKFCTERE